MNLITGMLAVAAACGIVSCALAGEAKGPSPLEMVLANTKALDHPQGNRPPLVFWTPNLPSANNPNLEKVLAELKARGIGLMHRWGGDPEKSTDGWIKIGLIQKKLGMPILVDGTGHVHGFLGGDDTGHVDKDGKRFRDKSFNWQPPCPFAIQPRFEAKRKVYEAFAQKYKDAGLTVDYWMADFEFDGPNEWNDGWAAAKQCTVCREKIPTIDTDFLAWQKAARDARTAMQHDVWVQPLKAAFPAIRIGNYGMNSHDGFRYYKDFYEKFDPNLPHKKDQNMLYRPWAKEFEPSGYTLAMPVVYTWGWIFDAYTFPNKQYRWFYNMLLESTSVAKSTPASVPIMPFVHWSTTDPAKTPLEGFEAMSRETYEELLWHMLLRGCDTFAMWSPGPETAVEVQPVQKVYGDSLQYTEFLDKGKPVLFDVPKQPGTVVSALQLGGKLLVRRTDFAGNTKPMEVTIDGKKLSVPAAPGKCSIIDIK
ncbi:MAG TPA: hypothetical protein VM223_02405 [Planctomycetota bacterium]|nr:hypothetical protein [Planctomycetota bacterium]